jgi:hypothetical protein
MPQHQQEMAGRPRGRWSLWVAGAESATARRRRSYAGASRNPHHFRQVKVSTMARGARLIVSGQDGVCDAPEHERQPSRRTLEARSATIVALTPGRRRLRPGHPEFPRRHPITISNPASHAASKTPPWPDPTFSDAIASNPLTSRLRGVEDTSQAEPEIAEPIRNEPSLSTP